ncbi:MAG TPA: TetR/AcrR family transcriptional regulator [Streptosporangiaceae bacterium]|nr:TetR/AcrR family transcriptional regulator [Streptosporangiaceae bacterium]
MASESTTSAGETTRRRAPGMSPEQRREMIVAAALPLVAEYGAKVTTSQVARVAGIGEATIFRVFADKEELLDAVLAEALRHNVVIREIASIPLEEPLADRLAEAAEALSAHLTRLISVMGALHTSGYRHERGERPEATPMKAREQSVAELRAAVCELFEPDEETLRIPREQAASMFLGLLFSQARPGADVAVLTTAELVDTFLYGAVTPGTAGGTTVQ